MRGKHASSRGNTHRGISRLLAVGLFMTVLLCTLLAGTTTALAGTYGRESLGDATLNQRIYDKFLAEIKKIAAGEQPSTILTVTLDDLGVTSAQLQYDVSDKNLYMNTDELDTYIDGLYADLGNH